MLMSVAIILYYFLYISTDIHTRIIPAAVTINSPYHPCVHPASCYTFCITFLISTRPIPVWSSTSLSLHPLCLSLVSHKSVMSTSSHKTQATSLRSITLLKKRLVFLKLRVNLRFTGHIYLKICPTLSICNQQMSY